MTSAFEDIFTSNAAYARATGASPLLPLKAGRGLAVVMCVDARTEPLSALGLALGDAAIVRNLGGQVTDETLSALILAIHRLGVDRVLVMQHTDCALTKFSSVAAKAAITEATGVDASCLAIDTIDDQAACVRSDVERIRSSPFVPARVSVTGAIFDLQSNVLTAV